MATRYSCPICKYTTYTGYICEHPERAASLMGAVDYANKVAGPQPKAIVVSKSTFDEISDALGVDKNTTIIHRCNIDVVQLNKDMPKMTREEAYNKVRGFIDVGRQNDFLLALEALGLLKFEQPVDRSIQKPNVVTIYEQESYLDFGTIRLELWPEGFVLWVGGEIRYKSWETQPKAYKTVPFAELHDAYCHNPNSLFHVRRFMEAMNTKGWKIVKEG